MKLAEQIRGVEKLILASNAVGYMSLSLVQMVFVITDRICAQLQEVFNLAFQLRLDNFLEQLVAQEVLAVLRHIFTLESHGQHLHNQMFGGYDAVLCCRGNI
jgi:hypothetical protein